VDELFGLSMQTIMYVLLGVFAVSVLSVGYTALTNRHMFKMGIRNLPRRGLQTGLIVIGLMLATLIITAAFTTGDTIDHSITSQAYDHWQRTDIVINLRGEESEDAIGTDLYVTESVPAELQQHSKDDPQIDLFMPFLYQTTAATSQRTHLSEPTLHLVGVDREIMNQAGGLRNTSGGTFDLTSLADDDVLLSDRAADGLDARVGDALTLFVKGHDLQVRVAGIVEDEQASGTLGNFDDPMRVGGVVMRLTAAQRTTARAAQVNYISVALKGDVRSTAGPEVEGAAERLTAYLNSAEGKELLNLRGRGDLRQQR
jgi:putative ABC transport system permease protein